jgi:hypothetical protein
MFDPVIAESRSVGSAFSLHRFVLQFRSAAHSLYLPVTDVANVLAWEKVPAPMSNQEVEVERSDYDM